MDRNLSICLAGAFAALLAFGSGPARAVTSTWGGGTGLWDDSTQWDSDPLYPCNGQGGNDYDVLFGSGTVTLNLDCTVDSYTQSGGTRDGAFDLTIVNSFSWTGGDLAGSGTTTVNGGLDVSTSGVYSLDGTHTLIQAGGAGEWSNGTIDLESGGSTFRNEATWNLTGLTRSMRDTNDLGSFVNSASGVVNVDLFDEFRTVTISTGNVLNEGTLNANEGTLELAGGGTHTGTFAGTATIEFGAGTQVLGAGSSVTVGNLEVSGGTLDVDPGASYAAGHTLINGGTLNVVDAGDTVTSSTALLSSGNLLGPGTFETTGKFTWSGGDMGGIGTTTVGGGLDVTTSGIKDLAGTRTLIHGGGTGTWSAGNIDLGDDAATVRNDATWNITGVTRSMRDTDDEGSFVNAASGSVTGTLFDSFRTVTFSTGNVLNQGTLTSNQGTLELAGDGTHTGTFAGTSTIEFGAGTQVLGAGSSVTVANLAVSGGTLDVDPAASYAAGNTLINGGTLTVVDAGDTLTSGSATLSSGNLLGPGTFETTGSFTWSGGDMGGTGTTLVLGGLDVTTSSIKDLAGTRTLIHGGGTGTWSAGNIDLGDDAATVRNETTWNIAGVSRSMRDTDDEGSFVNTATGSLNVSLFDAFRLLTISTGSFSNAGVIALQQGNLEFDVEFVQTSGVTRIETGLLRGPPLLDFQGGMLEGSGDIDGDVEMAGLLAPGLSPASAGGQLDIDGFLTLEAGSAFDVELFGPAQGTGYDFVTATGAVALDGILGVDVEESFRFSVPATPFVVLEQTGGSPLTGSFTNVASGDRVFTPDLDSFVVHYGAGSPTGAHRVVLEDYVMFDVTSGLMIGGTAAGGTITMWIEGVMVEVVLTPGMTAEQVAAALADAINANDTLRQMGILATLDGAKFFTNGLLTQKTNTDAGITLSSPFDVPALTGLGLALLSGLLASVGLQSSRRRRRIV